MTSAPRQSAGTSPGGHRLLARTSAWREAVFLTLNLAFFLAACALWRYLGSGAWMDVSLASLLEELVAPLGRILQSPLEVTGHPWMIVVVGLLLAELLALPILVAVLYRLWLGVGLALIVAAVAHAPLLALAVGLGCWLAARTPLRAGAPFFAVTLGLVPVVAYLVLSAVVEVQTRTDPPLQRVAQVAPFALAMVAALVSSAAALGLLRLLRYRPGFLWPVLAVLTAVPAAVFFDRVGRGELEYCVIVRNLAPGDMVFKSQRLKEYLARPENAGLNEGTLRLRLQDGLDRRRNGLVQRCRLFRQRFPRRVRTPAVLWVQAQCASLEINERNLRSDPPVLSYTARYVVPESEPLWRALSEDYPGSPQAALARWHLAELALQRADVQAAMPLLESAETGLQNVVNSPGAAGPFDPPESVPGRAYCAAALPQVQRLRWLVEKNHLLYDPNAAEAMAALMRIDPTRGDYGRQVVAMLDDPNHHYGRTALGDNLLLAVAKATADVQDRSEMYYWLAQDDTAAAVEANYELGLLVLREPVLALKEGIAEPRVYFQKVLDHQPNPWAADAALQLARLGSPASGSATP
jgi:hypothetical protein